MNKTGFLFLFLLLIAARQTNSQNILTIIEKDRDKKYLDRNNDFKPEYINNSISDINSVLEIRLDRNGLAAGAATAFGDGMPENLAEKISAILLALEKRNEVLAETERITKTFDAEKFKSDPAAYQKYVTDLSAVSQVIYEIERIDPRIETESYKYEDPDQLFSGVYMAAEDVLREMTQEAGKYAEENGVNIQFGCWLITRSQNVPVHLRGFDEIAPQEFYEVERWQFIPSDQQISQMEELQKLAAENRDLGLNIMKITAQNQLSSLKEFSRFTAGEILRELDTELQNLSKEIDPARDPEIKMIIDRTDHLKTSLITFCENLGNRLEFYQRISFNNENEILNLIKHLKSDLSFILEEDGVKLQQESSAFLETLEGLKPVLSAKIQQLKNVIAGFVFDYGERYKLLKNNTIRKIDEMINGRNFDIAALEFGDEVFRLSLTELPSSTELDLVTTGVRTEGDRLAFKLAVSGKGKSQQVILESREIFLFKVLPHVISTVGVIFADPLARNAVQTQFQMAPYYNFLFKGLGDQNRRRKSVLYNRLFDYGIGLNIAAPDFNKDDVPEITAGVVISLLHDYIQGGFGVNLFTGDPFWFFGLRFPVPAFNIGSGSRVEVE